MSVDPNQPADPNAPPPEDDDLGIIETESNAKGDKVVPLSALIDAKKALKEANKALKTLEPQIQQFNQYKGQIEAAAPFLQQLQTMTPEQQAKAIAVAKGDTAQTRSTEPQPQDDEAREMAEDLGLIDAHGNLDVARGRRMLDRLDKRAATKVDATVRQHVQPLQDYTAQSAASVAYQRAIAAADPNTGIPFASKESIDEAFAALPPHLAANPNVQGTIIGSAMYLDRLKGRTPKAPVQAYHYADPELSLPPAGRRGPVGLSEADRALAAKTGLDEKTMTAAVTALNAGKGIALE